MKCQKKSHMSFNIFSQTCGKLQNIFTYADNTLIYVTGSPGDWGHLLSGLGLQLTAIFMIDLSIISQPTRLLVKELKFFFNIFS